MALKKYNPVTSSMRGLIRIDRSHLWKGRPLKSLTKGIKNSGGRNNLGRITSWQKGGGHKKLYRVIDFKRNKLDIEAVVERIEHDPNRTAHIALVKYLDGEYSYIIAPNKLNVGDKVISAVNAEIKHGNSLPLQNIPVGTQIHNVEVKLGKGAQLARSAGSYAQITAKDNGFAQIRLKSGEIRLVSLKCFATIGVVSNSAHQNQIIGKAGRNRWLGKRPIVRGVAMNPIDHPHGGGEGKTSGGRHPVTPWGKPTKGKKTRSKKKSSKYILKRRK